MGLHQKEYIFGREKLHGRKSEESARKSPMSGSFNACVHSSTIAKEELHGENLPFEKLSNSHKYRLLLCMGSDLWSI